MVKTNKSGKRIAAVILAAISCLLGLAILAYIFRPLIANFYVTRIKYDVNGGITETLKDSELFADLKSGRSICFLGDSITKGTATGGTPWYNSAIPYIKGKVSNLSQPGWMVKDLIDSENRIPVSDVYVVAIGINDILLPKSDRSSADPSEYVKRLDRLAQILKTKSSGAKIYFITPWPFDELGNICDKLLVQFHEAILAWCKSKDYICIDPMPIINEITDADGDAKYMADEFHPNSTKGVDLYCYAVLLAAHEGKSAKR